MRKKTGILGGIVALVVMSLLATLCVNMYTGRLTLNSIQDFSQQAMESVSEELSGLQERVDSLESQLGSMTASSSETGALAGPYSVVRVVDGDTAMIDIDGAETRVRFIGVDTPESVNPDEAKNTDEGLDASAFTKQLLAGSSVYLEYDIEKQDKYGRTLAYVYLPDGETMVQDILLSEGLAMTMTIQPNSKYAKHFSEIQKQARENGAGFWATGFFA